jgi:hypothetical protein
MENIVENNIEKTCASRNQYGGPTRTTADSHVLIRSVNRRIT